MLTKAELQELGIIQGGHEECWDESNYNLRLGEEYVLVTGEEPEAKNCSQFGITIPPFGCVLVSTAEWLKMPQRVYGRWGLRIRPALSGLIFQAGPQIEPGYKGRLFGLLFNLSSMSCRLSCLQDLWSIDFTAIGTEKISAASAGEPEEKHMRITGYTTQGIPHGGLSDALARFTDVLKDIEALKKDVVAEKATLVDKVNGATTTLSEEIQREMGALRLDRETERNNQLAASQEEMKTKNKSIEEMQKNLGDKKDYLLAIVVGVIMVIAAGLLPMGISKVTFDKDFIVKLAEEKSGMAEIARNLTEANAKLQLENAALRDRQAETDKLISALQKDFDKAQARWLAVQDNRPAEQNPVPPVPTKQTTPAPAASVPPTTATPPQPPTTPGK